MATKVKPSRLQVSGTPQAGQVPVYVNEDCFQWCNAGGCAQWGCITGTLCNQTDLQGALNCKANACDVPTDNCQLANGCGYTTCTGTVVVSDLTPYAKTCDLPDFACYQTKSCMVSNLSSPDDNHYPTSKAVADAMACAGTGDMLKSVYDPNNIQANVYDYCNFVNTPTIPTNNNQLANGCGFTTCTGTLVASDLNPYATCVYVNDAINSVAAYYITKNAQGDQWASYAELAAATTFYSGGAVRVPTRNDYTVVLDDETHSNATTRYSYQGSGWEYQYTIHETPLTQAQLDALNSGITAAKVSCYDAIPIITDNCQIANGCGYTTCTGTVSTCADVISALGYTPYSTGNPCNYINNFAGVISALGYTPYNTTNPCGYTTCTGTLTASNISDTAYGSSWNGVTTVAPSKNAVYDKIESVVSSIPTNNNQLTNGCGYTTCTGTLTSGDLKTVNGNSLVGSGDITISGGITKIFTLASTSDLTTAQAAYDYYLAGGNPIIKYIFPRDSNNPGHRYFTNATSSAMYFTASIGQGNNTYFNKLYVARLSFTISNGTISAIGEAYNYFHTSSTAPTSAGNNEVTFVL